LSERQKPGPPLPVGHLKPFGGGGHLMEAFVFDTFSGAARAVEMRVEVVLSAGG